LVDLPRDYYVGLFDILSLTHLVCVAGVGVNKRPKASVLLYLSNVLSRCQEIVVLS